MTYAIQQDMIDRFGEDEIIQLTDRDGLGVVNTDVLDRAFEDAQDLIDSYLRKRFTLPLSSVPRILKGIACAIARKKLFDDGAPEEVTNNYKEAVDQLKQISKGQMDIGLDEIATTPATTDGPIFVETTQIFSMNKMEDF